MLAGGRHRHLDLGGSATVLEGEAGDLSSHWQLVGGGHLDWFIAVLQRGLAGDSCTGGWQAVGEKGLFYVLKHF